VLRRVKGDYSDFPVHFRVNTKMILKDSVRKLK